MTYSEAIRFLYDLRLFGLKLGLENTFKLAALAGNPQNKLRFIHVAGTNGKGSTCAMLESIYRAAGLRVGLFTSPHLVSFRERIQVNRRLIGEADVVRLVGEIKDLIEEGWPQPEAAADDVAASFSLRNSNAGAHSLKAAATSEDERRKLKLAATDASHPSFFEVVTVMGLRYFAEQKCDLVIWETGMGGRLDATNIVTPLASVITNVQFDHEQWLGNTRAEIAAEKAGIIKPGVPVITATDAPEALVVVEQTAREKNAPLTRVGQASRLSLAAETAALPLLGEHQKLNAALAIATVRALQNRIPVSNDAIRIGLETLQWPGRLQLVRTKTGQTILLDGAHNVAGTEALRDALRSEQDLVAIPICFPGTGRQQGRQDAGAALIFGVLEDKDWRAMCEILAPLTRRVLLVPVQNERTASPKTLLDGCRTANPAAQVTTCPSLADALKLAANDPFLIITGSLYLVGEAMELLGLSPATSGSERELNEWTVKK